MSYDPRITPARADLAAAHLIGKVEAARFVEGEKLRVRYPVTSIRNEPRPDAAFTSEVVLGEVFTVYDRDEEGWAWGQAETDGYVGWLAGDALGPLDPAPTHRVIVPRSHFYPIPGFKAPPLAPVGLGAMVHVMRVEERHAATPQGFIRATHIAPLDQPVPDFVAAAERMLGAPYVWGGKSGDGCDCSGLVQMAMAVAGRVAPRDSDMQQGGLGTELPMRPNALQRGDLVFWKGHVGIMQDAIRLLHANVWHMAVASEPLDDAIERIRTQGGGEPTGFRRP